MRAVEPLLYEARASKLFAELLRRVSDHEVVEMEFTYLANAAVVRFGVDFADQEAVLQLCEKIKGAINLACEKLLRDSDRTVLELHNVLGLEKLYRLGLTDILSIRSLARKVPLEVAEKFKDSDNALFSIVACAREPFPCIPVCINDDGSVVENGGALPTGGRPIDSLQALASVRVALERVIAEKV